MALDKFKLKDSSIILLKDTSYGVAKRISTLDSVNPEAKGIVLNLIDVMFAMFGKAVTGCEVTEDFKKDNETLFVFTDFLAKAVVLSYYGLLDNDKNLAKLKQRAEEAHQKEVAEGKASGKKLDFMFGFDGLSDVVAIAVGFINDVRVPAKMVEGRAMSNMLSSMRNIGIGEYLSGG